MAKQAPRERLSRLLWSHLTSQGWEGLDPSETLALADAALAWVVADLTAAADHAPDDGDYYRGRKAGLSCAAARFNVSTPPGEANQHTTAQTSPDGTPANTTTPTADTTHTRRDQ